MNTIKLIIGSIAVYFIVATLYACDSSHVMGMTGGGGDAAGAGSGGATVTTASGHGGASGTAASTSGGGKGGGPAASSSGSGPVPNAEAEESGSRIKAMWRTGSDGSKQFVGFFDSALMVKCSYLPMADGKDYCLPYDPTVSAGPTGPFTDSACNPSSLVVVRQSIYAPCTAPKFAVTYGNQQCILLSVASSIYEIGAKIPTPATLYFNSGGQCFSSATQPGEEVYAIAKERPASDFVAATISIDP